MEDLVHKVSVDRWVCPNDRQLALRAKLGAGWSVHTNRLNLGQQSHILSLEEQDQIVRVISKADALDRVEQLRIGHLVEKLENMKQNAMGNGSSQCILCSDEFRLLGASPISCDDCRKAVCSKCGVDTFNHSKRPLWLCKICAETREVWKRSGAWFFKGLPKYTLPDKLKQDGSQHSVRVSRPQFHSSFRARPGSVRDTSYTWHRARGGGVGGSSTGSAADCGESGSDPESSESSDEDFVIAKHKRRKERGVGDSDSLGSVVSHSVVESESHISRQSSLTTSSNMTHGIKTGMGRHSVKSTVHRHGHKVTPSNPGIFIPK